MRPLFAALTLFTRLPFFARWARPQDFARAVEWWPAVGLATGGVMASVLWLARLADFPPMAAAAMALGARVLLTGAFHEDGLGDFFDGFGGGRTRERTLEIMKDSRTGSYGVVGLALYFLVAASLVSELGVAVVFAGDVLCKAVAGQLVNILPYARPAADSKVGAYRRMGAVGWVVSVAAILVAVLALGFGAFAGLFPTRMWWAVAVPVTVLAGLAWLMRRRIGGYTGDCCGATFLLCEVAFWMAIWLV